MSDQVQTAAQVAAVLRHAIEKDGWKRWNRTLNMQTGTWREKVGHYQLLPGRARTVSLERGDGCKQVTQPWTILAVLAIQAPTQDELDATLIPRCERVCDWLEAEAETVQLVDSVDWTLIPVAGGEFAILRWDVETSYQRTLSS